uniref:Uncharacterized protein n=1 Tax=Human herpesvirus 2 TaxID=10310 RepID=A0A481TAH7_HHV2|nr:hypothetical protein [Human alphaherpesvirus 2]QBH82804.1 hypothetical protein [Human alphaherpesvirus 2]QBH85158.1 hypothetical protein [Human alphaherpesvirus 2]
MLFRTYLAVERQTPLALILSITSSKGTGARSSNIPINWE